jgi:hypothetical protein
MQQTLKEIAHLVLQVTVLQLLLHPVLLYMQQQELTLGIPQQALLLFLWLLLVLGLRVEVVHSYMIAVLDILPLAVTVEVVED